MLYVRLHGAVGHARHAGQCLVEVVAKLQGDSAKYRHIAMKSPNFL